VSFLGVLESLISVCHGLRGMLVPGLVIFLSVECRSGAVSVCGELVVFSSLLVRFIGHSVAPVPRLLRPTNSRSILMEPRPANCSEPQRLRWKPQQRCVNPSRRIYRTSRGRSRRDVSFPRFGDKPDIFSATYSYLSFLYNRAHQQSQLKRAERVCLSQLAHGQVLLFAQSSSVAAETFTRDTGGFQD